MINNLFLFFFRLVNLLNFYEKVKQTLIPNGTGGSISLDDHPVEVDLETGNGLSHNKKC